MIADGNSPDVFVVPSTGAGLLESKTENIPGSLLDQNDLSKNLPKIFDPLAVITPGKNSEGKAISLTSYKGIPLGYETMALYYNRAVLNETVPATWEDFETMFGTASSTPPAALGLSARYIQEAASIVSLFFVQKGFTNLTGASTGAGAKALDAYAAYGKNTTGPDALSAQIPEMDAKRISTTDLFARGKVSVLFGFPSMIREIEYALKRAGSSASLERRDVRSALVPQYASGKKYNLARYNYFAVSKTAPHIDAAADFVAYLSTKEAGSAYAEAFPQYLPARMDVLEIRKEERNLAKGFQWIVYDSFIPTADTELVTFDRELTSQFEESLGQAVTPDASPESILAKVRKQIDCRKKQLLERSGYEVDCASD